MNSGKGVASLVKRRELFDRVWSKPMTTNAAELGTTPSALSTLAKHLGLPLPRAGHWMKKEVGKEPPTPDYPVAPGLDEQAYPLPAPTVRRVPRSTRAKVEALPRPDVAGFKEPAGSPAADDAPEPDVEMHKTVAGTRTAIQKNRSTDRASTGRRGKFRLLVAPASGERACSVLDRLVAAVEAKGWSLDNTEQGYAIVADGEAIGFMIEEKLDRVPHAVTAAEFKEKAEYDRKCALADRGIGYRPWPPSIPEYDYIPNGELVLKFDHDYDAGGTRRTFSDGKRQRLEDLIPSMIDSLGRWSIAVKAKREERAQWQRDWEEKERRRQDRERQARVEGYRITFLQRQIERKRELDGLAALIATWEEMEETDTKFAELLAFARLYRLCLEDKIAPSAIAERIAALKLMDDDVYIYDAKRID